MCSNKTNVMKKIILLFIIWFSVNHFAEGQTNGNRQVPDILLKNNSKLYEKTNVPFLDSVVYWTWDSVTHVWIFNLKADTLVYNSNNKITHYILLTWLGNSWMNSQQIITTYNSNNDDSIVFTESWNGVLWLNSSQNILTYDVNNNQTLFLLQIWNGASWNNSSQTTYTYNMNNLETSNLNQVWNGTAWVNNHQSFCTYDLNNNRIDSLTQTWNGTIWVNSGKHNYTYDVNNNQLTDLQQTWNGSSWVNSGESFNTFDSNNNLTMQLFQYWTGTIFSNSVLYTYTLDANDIVTEVIIQNWNGVAWVNSRKTHYYFHNFFVQGINNSAIEDNSALIAPNPFSCETYITFKTEQARTIEIMNALGEMVFKTTINNLSSFIDMSGYAKGIYFVKITDRNKKSSNKKIIVQ